MASIADKQAVAVGWFSWRAGKLRYGNSQPGKLNPDSSGYSDCSGAVHASYRDLGINVGTMSYTQAKQGVEVASGTTTRQFLAAQSRFLPGDVIAMDLKYSKYTGRVNHVEMYAGGGNSWGHGGPGLGPTFHSAVISWLIPSARFWTVRRFITSDDPTPPPPLPPAPKEFLQQLVENMNATHIIFVYDNTIFIADVLAGTYRAMPDPPTFETTIYVLQKAGAKIVQWCDLAVSDSNTVGTPAAFGIRIN